MRRQYEMTEEQLADLLAACKPVPAIMLQCGPIQGPQARANAAWARLGREMGFRPMTVRPVEGRGERYFSAEPAGSSSSPEP